MALIHLPASERSALIVNDSHECGQRESTLFVVLSASVLFLQQGNRSEPLYDTDDI